MARSIDTIFNNMLANSEVYPSLAELNGSAASVYQLILRVCAISVYNFEVVLDVFRQDITDRAKAVSAGTERFFVQKAYEFQFDETTPQVLQVTDRQITYETIDTALNIITQAACVTTQDSETKKNIVFIKLAKGTVTLEPLSNDELEAATSYFNDLKMAGQQLEVVSQAPDRLFIDADIYYDGQFIQTQVAEQIETDLTAFLSDLDFDGIVKLQSVVDVIQQVDGVDDVVLKSIAGRDINTPVTNREVFRKEYNPDSGYMILEDDTNNNLDKKLTYYVV